MHINSKNIIVGLLTLWIILFGHMSFGQNSSKLTDGRYLIRHTLTYGYPDLTILIEGGRFTANYDKINKSTGTIEWISDRLFALHSDNTQNTDSLNNVQKALLSMGGECYELIGRKKFRLTHCGNLHITISEGQIIKID